MKVDTLFDMEQNVEIKATAQVGLVSAILINKNTEYQVVFWDKGVRRQEWVREVELKPVESKPELGFKSTPVLVGIGG